jgi:hypothetical protein
MEKIMSKTDKRTKIMDAQQTSEARELTAAELDSVNGGSPSILQVAAGMVIQAVGEAVYIPLVQRGLL